MTEFTNDPKTLTPREVFERQRQTILNLDTDGQADLFAVDGVMEFPFAAAGLPPRLEGREQIRRVIGAAAQPLKQAGMQLFGYHSLVVHETTDPEVLIVEFELEGKIGDHPFKAPYIQVFRIRNGEIVSLRDYFTGRAMSTAVAAVTGSHEP